METGVCALAGSSRYAGERELVLGLTHHGVILPKPSRGVKGEVFEANLWRRGSIKAGCSRRSNVSWQRTHDAAGQRADWPAPTRLLAVVLMVPSIREEF